MHSASLSRRSFFAAVAAMSSAAAACTSTAAPMQAQGGAGTARRTLIKGGCVLSLDPAIGDFDVADVLVDGTRIADVRPNITADADIIDASGCVVMPGFVDTHRHMWQGALRNLLPDGLLADY